MDKSEAYLYGLGLGVAATAAECLSQGIRLSASDQPPTATEALDLLAKVLSEMADAHRARTGS